ncbi:MAG: extracellular solute-binding protein, partial [Spirochaetota bacterium]
ATTNIVIGINTDVLKKKGLAPPRSWADLLKPEYKALTLSMDPTWGGTAYTFLYTMNFVMKGNETDFRPGFKYLKALKDNGTAYVSEIITDKLISGECAIAIDAEGNILHGKYVRKAPIEVVIPSEGVSSMALAMGMAKGAPEPDLTKSFYDWLIGPKAQGLVAQAFFRPVIANAIPADFKDKFPSTEGRMVVYSQDNAAEVAPSLKKAFTEYVVRGADLEKTLRKHGLLK